MNPYALALVMTCLSGSAAAVDTREGAIVSGRPAAFGEAPGVAAVVFRGGVVRCTGVLVAPSIVVTAKHCVDSGPVVGVALETDTLAAPGTVYAMGAIWRAPGDMDYALLVTATPTTTAPADLAPDGALAAGEPVVVAGYGAIDTAGVQFGKGLSLGRAHVTQASCLDETLGCLAPFEVIAEGDSDTCNGDSGGPLYLDRAGRRLLAAITLRGLDLGEATCGQGGIYLPVAEIAASLDGAGLGAVLGTAGGALTPDEAAESVPLPHMESGCATRSASPPSTAVFRLGCLFSLLAAWWRRERKRGAPWRPPLAERKYPMPDYR